MGAGKMKSIKLKELKLFFISLSVFLVIGSLFIKPPQGLSRDGFIMLAIIIAMLILFLSEAMPQVAICFFVIIAMKYTGVSSWDAILRTSASSAVFFCMAGFGLGAALQNTNLAPILICKLYRLCGGDSGKLISIICWMTAIISVFVANGAAQIVVISLVTTIIKSVGNPEPGKSRMAAGLMMAIIVGATTGGICLPSSNNTNIIAMELSQTVGNCQMTYFQWAVFGIPCSFILTAFSAWLLPRYYKPEQLSAEQRLKIDKVFGQISGEFRKKDIYYMIIVSLMVILWIASNWVKYLDIVAIAMAGVFLMMLPGVELLNAKDYKMNFSPMNIVTLLCFFPMAAAMTDTGAGQWAVNRIFNGVDNWNGISIIVISILAAFLVHCFIPAGSANTAFSVALITPILVNAGIPVSAAIVMVGLQTGTGFLLPIEGTWQYTFGLGYYSFADCIKGNWKITLIGMFCSMILIPLLSVLYLKTGLLS